MTMYCCLICFRLVSPDENNLLGEQNDEEKLQDFQRYFKMLNRHLKIDEIEVNDDINKTVFSNFEKAWSCEECMKEMSSFCEVYHKIKTLELILNQKLRTLMNIMFCAGKVPARVACFKETLASKLDTSGPSADDRINEILQYKKLLIAKCSEKLSGTYPKLILKRISKPMIEDGQNLVISNDMSLPLPTICPVTTFAPLFEEEVEAPESHTSAQIDTADCFEDFTAPSSPIAESTSLDLSCKVESLDEKIQMRHLSNNEDEINDEVSTEVDQVEDMKINPQLSSTESKAPSTKRSLRTIHKCSKCGRTFSSSEKLSNHHSSETCNEEKQSKIELDPEQDDEGDNLFKTGSESSSTEDEEDVKPSAENESKIKKVKTFAKRSKRQSKTKKVRTSPKDICPVCQKVIPTPPNSSATANDELSQHMFQEHPEAFKTPGIPQPFSCPVFYCPFAADNVRSLTNHCTGKHKAEFKLRIRYENQDRLERDLENPLHCPFPNCDAACLTRAILTIHLKSAHDSEWNPKNLTILSRKFFTDRMNGMEKAVRDISSQLNEDSDGDGEKEELKKRLRIKCPECCEGFSHFYEMILHRKNDHLDSNESLLEDKLTIEIINLREKESEAHLKMEIGSSKVFSCAEGNPPCEQLFLFQEDLEAHRKLHGEFKCQYCEFTEENAVKLAEHELKEHSDGEFRKETEFSMNIKCPRCDEKFTLKYKYLDHFVTEHLGLERLMEQCCPICRDPHGFQSWTNELSTRVELRHLFKYHNLLSVKDPKDIFGCKEEGCFAYFLNLNQLRNHTRLVHSFEKDSKTFYNIFISECKDCGKVFKRIYDLRTHRLRFHVKDSDKISCTVEGCEQKFEFEKELTYHIKLSHINQNHLQIQICPKCGKSWKGTASFQKHMAAHGRKEKAEADGLIAQSFVCESCGKGFKSKGSLDKHILLRHKGSESWKFQCKTCNKKCFDAHKLTEHMRTHTNEKPFICQVCGAAYGHRHNLRIHVNNKHGDVIQDITQKRDTSNLFRRKKIDSNRDTIKKKVKKRISQMEVESNSD